MEKYELRLRHYVEDEDTNKFVEIEDEYVASVMIPNLYTSMMYYKENAVRTLCDSLIEYIRGEE